MMDSNYNGRSTLNSAIAALDDLWCRIPQDHREKAVRSREDLRQALYLLSRALDFRAQIDSNSIRFSMDIGRAANGELEPHPLGDPAYPERPPKDSAPAPQ